LRKNKKSEKLGIENGPPILALSEFWRVIEAIIMAEGKMNGKCNCGHGKKYTLFGVLAIVYGIITYMISVMNWQPYMAWIIGGVILLLIAWAKGSVKS
jgi:hypothetical protein